MFWTSDLTKKSHSTLNIYKIQITNVIETYKLLSSSNLYSLNRWRIQVVILALVILFADKLFLFNFEGPVVCPRGWIPWNSMCYYFSSDSLSSKMSWQEALQECRTTRGGDLVSIHSASENIFIKSKIFRWVVFKKTSHWFFKPLLCCSACLGQFTIWATIFKLVMY